MTNTTYKRDEKSNALINTDKQGLQAYKQKRELALKEKESLEYRLSSMENSIALILKHLGINE